VLEDPHLKAREMLVEMDDPARGKYIAMGCPIKIASNPVDVKPPPLLSEHSDEVFSDLLGLGEEELTSLRSSGVI
jgi:crotonobetainyl-CoA:carnitine CoA-transferase CaiB-like acyl-CoA transferase